MTVRKEADGCPDKPEAVEPVDPCADVCPTTIQTDPDNPLCAEVTPKEGACFDVNIKSSDVPQYHYEKSGYICGEGGTWVCELYVWVDGVQGETQTIDSGISCDEPKPSQDPEIKELPVCIDGLAYIQLCQIVFENDGEGNITAGEPVNIGDPIPTGETCGKQAVEVDTCEGTEEVEVDQVVALKGVVTTKPCPEDKIEIDTEYVCNADTGVYDQFVVVTTNGVAADPVITPTTVSCDDDEPDFEQVRVCNADGFIHIVTTAFAEDGSAATLSDIATIETCVAPAKQDVEIETCEGTDSALVDSEVVVRGVVQTKPCTAPVISYDYELACVDGSLALVTITTTDGTAITGDPVAFDPAIDCEDPSDFEYARSCEGEFAVLNIYENGGQEPVGTIETTEPCPKDCVKPANMRPMKKRKFSIFYDNGVTPGSSSNNCGERPNFIRFNWAMKSLGWVTGVGTVGVGDAIGPYTGWSPQLNGWSDFGELHDPYGSTHAFNFQPAPTWRSWTIDGCNPNAVYGPWTLQREDGCIFTVYPLRKEADVIEKVWFLDTMDCDGNPTTKYYRQTEAGDYIEIATPSDLDCFVPCDYKFDDVIAPDAVSECDTKEYTLCDRVEGVDTQFIQLITICGSDKTVERYTLDSWLNAQSPDDLVEYEVQGVVYVCGSDDVFVEPEPETNILTPFKTNCPDLSLIPDANYGGAMPITSGRPLPTVPWALIDNRDPENQVTIAAGDTFQEFSDDLAAKGYTQFIEGEIHYICPCPAGYSEFTNPDGQYFTTADGDTVTKGGCTPLTELRSAPEKPLAEEKCALQTLGCLDEQILKKLCEISDKLTDIIGSPEDGCPCDEEVTRNKRCQSYASILGGGYRNWTDTDDFDDLADEFGITPTAKEHWLRITEFKCDGVSQSSEGQIFGPYTIDGTTNGYDTFLADLSTATANACLNVSAATGGGSNGVSGMIYEYDDAQTATLVIQEGVTVGGVVGWFTSAQAVVVRGGAVGDFISSSGNGATTNYDAITDSSDFDSYMDAEGCVDV